MPIRKQTGAGSAARNRLAVTAVVGLATIMQALDTTIANVSLPYIQGSLAANLDQVEWVLTSYIVAAAIMTPPTGYLTRRFGLKRIFMTSIAGFTIGSMLCGMAGSIGEIVVFRMIQGAFGAALVPLSQAVLMNTYPPERQGRAIAYWGMAIMVGPIAGPVLGGWLTENYSWRWDFYINLPVGCAALVGMWIFLRDTRRSDARLDWFGFATLSLAIGAFQIMLDRGQELDWFGSMEIVLLGVLAGSAFWLFLANNITAEAPFLPRYLLHDRNFVAGTIFIFIIGASYFTPLALLPNFLQNLVGYPILTAGFALAPRGFGTLAAMLVVGRLVGRLDTRIMLAIGIILDAWSVWDMTGWNQDVSQTTVALNGVIQGAGVGFIFVPLSVTTLATLPAERRTEGAGFYNLARNIGQSIGTAIAAALLVRLTQENHAEIGAVVTATNRLFANPHIAAVSPYTAAGRAALDAAITTQAQVIAYIDDFKLLTITTVAALPLLLLFKAPPRGGNAPPPSPAANPSGGQPGTRTAS
ncbi:MAG TPA: DHA2 family efflux MFS transporter permease subunit [Stellaceae bacterium]|nr:DHA2 family efflux MFS transporter permease subunit [Stellaceae bacterium]